jgi:hypothetical protein
MNAGSSRWRRWAVTLVQHAVRVLPGAQSPWADAMRRELDYIGDDPAALRWALGCVLASYKVRLTHRPSGSVAVTCRQITWRQFATCGALMLMIGLALQDNADGQTEPPRPALDETACERPGVSGELRSDRAVSVRRNDHRTASHSRPDCPDPLASKIPDARGGR